HSRFDFQKPICNAHSANDRCVRCTGRLDCIVDRGPFEMILKQVAWAAVVVSVVPMGIFGLIYAGYVADGHLPRFFAAIFVVIAYLNPITLLARNQASSHPIDIGWRAVPIAIMHWLAFAGVAAFFATHQP